MDKSYVGLSQCFFCGGNKNEIMFDRLLRNRLPHRAVYDKEPCDKCKEYMQMGIILISVKNKETDRNNPYKTGGWCVVKEDAVKRFPFDSGSIQSMLDKRVAFLEDEVWDMIGLPR